MALERNARRKAQHQSPRDRGLGYTLPDGRRAVLAEPNVPEPDPEPRQQADPADLVSAVAVLLGLALIGTGTAFAVGWRIALIVVGGLVLAIGLLIGWPGRS
jgi:hypothetical protein